MENLFQENVSQFVMSNVLEELYKEAKEVLSDPGAINMLTGLGDIHVPEPLLKYMENAPLAKSGVAADILDCVIKDPFENYLSKAVTINEEDQPIYKAFVEEVGTAVHNKVKFLVSISLLNMFSTHSITMNGFNHGNVITRMSLMDKFNNTIVNASNHELYSSIESINAANDAIDSSDSIYEIHVSLSDIVKYVCSINDGALSEGASYLYGMADDFEPVTNACIDHVDIFYIIAAILNTVKHSIEFKVDPAPANIDKISKIMEGVYKHMKTLPLETKMLEYNICNIMLGSITYNLRNAKSKSTNFAFKNVVSIYTKINVDDAIEDVINISKDAAKVMKDAHNDSIKNSIDLDLHAVHSKYRYDLTSPRIPVKTKIVNAFDFTPCSYFTMNPLAVESYVED